MKFESRRLARVASVFAGAVLSAWAFSASATPITGPITATLTGDIRPANPDGILVNVTITPVSATQVSWVVDLNMDATHPDAKLGEFYFNVVEPANQYSFSNFDPGAWAVKTPADVAGAGGASFVFEASDPPPGPPVDVTNTQSLSFLMSKATDFMLEDFLNAGTSSSNDAGSGQLGAHVQSLELTGGATTDSGFAFGSYTGGGGGNPPDDIPEPATLSLLGFGLAGLGGLLYGRRRRQAA